MCIAVFNESPFSLLLQNQLDTTLVFHSARGLRLCKNLGAIDGDVTFSLFEGNISLASYSVILPSVAFHGVGCDCQFVYRDTSNKYFLSVGQSISNNYFSSYSVGRPYLTITSTVVLQDRAYLTIISPAIPLVEHNGEIHTCICTVSIHILFTG